MNHSFFLSFGLLLTELSESCNEVQGALGSRRLAEAHFAQVVFAELKEAFGV